MKSLLYLLLLLCFQVSYAQHKIDNVSASFKDTNLTEALLYIEKATDYQFFYLDKWLESKHVTGVYTNAPLDDVLTDIFKNTVINFYITPDKKIILTQNTVVYSTLPIDFFETPEEETSVLEDEEIKTAPILYISEQTINSKKVIHVGKEDSTNRKNRFTLNGVIRNAQTREVIPNLALVVKNQNIGVVTDINGYYSIELPAGLNQIEFNALGIEKKKQNLVIYNDGQLDFALNESLEVLEEVIVKADANKNIEQSITGVSQIEVAKIKTIPLVLGERDILKVATTLPGISTAGEGAAGYNVRGGKTDQNLILLDNAVIYNPSHFFGIFSALNPFTTSGVSIYKGSIPAEYGGRLSSVFDIETKDGNVEKISGEASLGPVTSNLVLEVPVVKNKSSVIVGGRATYSKWILKSLKSESLKNSNASFSDLIAKYHHKINANNVIRATVYYSNDAFNISSDSVYGYDNRLFSLNWNHKFNDKSSSSLSLTNSQYRFNITYDNNSVDAFDLGYRNEETEAKLKFKYLYKKKHSLDFGLSSKLYGVYPGSIQPIEPQSNVLGINIPKEKGLESAIFLSDDYKVTEKLLLNLGLRYSLFAALGEQSQRIYEDGIPKSESTFVETRTFGKNEAFKTYGGPEARISARYFIKPDLSVKASFGNTYQFIHTLSNNTTVSPTDTWKLSDINIKPQRASQFALGLYKNIDNDTYELSIESYYKKLNDIIDYKVGSELLLNETIETEVFQGEGKAYGIEVLLRKNKGILNGWLGYTYARSLIRFESEFKEEQINNGDFFPSNYDKPHDISFVGNYKLTKRFSLSTNFVYQTGRPTTYPIGTYVYRGQGYAFYSNRNEFRIPDYYRMDVSFNVEGNHKIKKFAHSFWNFSIYNLFGRKNAYSVFFATENGQVRSYKSTIFSVPIPTITYNFKF
tara:strand:+ start:935 stop:3694 length:2760 start_codon:yes stop_codon:yes gene_type:complete